jgi:hypothetical protein
MANPLRQSTLGIRSVNCHDRPADHADHAEAEAENLYRSAKTAFGYHYPNYDVHALAHATCARQGWRLDHVQFYTGIPGIADNPFWNHFWTAKFAQMGRQGIQVFWRPLRYRNESVRLPDGPEVTVLVGREKGVDVRLALDAVHLAQDRSHHLRRLPRPPRLPAQDQNLMNNR